VRVTTLAEKPVTRVGIFAGVQDARVILQMRPAWDSIPLGSIRSVELSDGFRMSKPGGLAGLLVGASAGGFALGCLANRDDYGVLCAGQDDRKVLAGIVIGGLAGAAFGARVFRREQWRAIDFDNLRAR
jgi:hypothetical protein